MLLQLMSIFIKNIIYKHHDHCVLYRDFFDQVYIANVSISHIADVLKNEIERKENCVVCSQELFFGKMLLHHRSFSELLER